MDISESLKTAENSLRDLINYLLHKKLGTDWVNLCGVPDTRIIQWKERKALDEKKFGQSEPRLIYYADFYDIKTILKKCWDKGFCDVFGKLKELEVLLDLLNEIRNPNAHQRDLLPYQKHMAVGISGKIRAEITGYFSDMETGESYYPRIESIQDSLGNTWAIGDSPTINTGKILRPGDQLQFKIIGADPMGEDIEYCMFPNVMPKEDEWNKSGDFDLTIKDSYVAKNMLFVLAVKSPRKYQATSAPFIGKVDDIVQFIYEVLPPRDEC